MIGNNPRKVIVGNSGLFSSVNLYPRQEQSGRDKRRAFTESQKHEILHQQNYKCATCHKKLDLRVTEYDHIKPWADKGKTKIINGAALCPTCHRLKTHKETVRKVESRKKKEGRKHSDPLGLRNFKPYGFKP